MNHPRRTQVCEIRYEYGVRRLRRYTGDVSFEPADIVDKYWSNYRSVLKKSIGRSKFR